MRKSNLLNRMNQSARDREVVVVRYRCKGDSKHTEEVMLRCEIPHFKSKLKNVEEFVEKPGYDKKAWREIERQLKVARIVR